jgi:TorA maturation chaperone TorD
MQHADKSEIQIDRIDGVDTARMEEYALLAALLRQAPDSVLLKALSGIRINSTPLGAAHAALARAAAEADPERLKREFFELFIGVRRGELLPYGSYYLTGFLNERPLARLRDDLRMLGIVRAEQQHEPEDHAAILCEIMAGLAGGVLSAAPDAQKRLFEKHLAPWIGRFLADLEGLKKADFYRHVATVGRLFIDIETEAFALPS